MKTCCFIGHNIVKEPETILNRLTVAIETQIRNGADVFLFGSRSRFNDLCYLAVSELKEKYPRIKRVFVRAEYENIDKSYTDYLLESFERTYFAESARGAGRLCYVKRNEEMIAKSDVCIFYRDESVLPHASGTNIAFLYAVKKHKTVINVF